MAGVMCMQCGSGDDDNLLLLCDGGRLTDTLVVPVYHTAACSLTALPMRHAHHLWASYLASRCRAMSQAKGNMRMARAAGCDRAMHTWCAGLMAVPEGEWFCPECAAQQPQLLSGRANASAASQMLLLPDSDDDVATDPAFVPAAAEESAAAEQQLRGGRRRRGPLHTARDRDAGGGDISGGYGPTAHPLEDLEDGNSGASEGIDDEDDVLLSQRHAFTSTQLPQGQSLASRWGPDADNCLRCDATTPSSHTVLFGQG